MATVTAYKTPAIFANFKTAYLQKEVVLDVVPSVSASGKVGQIFSISGDVPSLLEVDVSASTSAAAIAAALASVSQGMYILAQGDQTMEYGHVPVEDRDYRYDPAVVFESGVTKKIAAYKIINLDDINIMAPVVSYTYSA